MNNIKKADDNGRTIQEIQLAQKYKNADNKLLKVYNNIN